LVSEAFRQPIQEDLPREHISTKAMKYNEMSTEPEEASEENPEKKDKIERVPEGTFGGTRERLSEVTDDEPVSDDTGDQGHGQN
jgi:hypothetical protein